MKEQRGRAIFNPGDFRAYLAWRRGKPESEIAVPEDLVFTYDSGIFRAAIAETRARRVEWYVYGDRLYAGNVGGKQVGITFAMMGAPAATTNLEELVAYGAKRIYELGMSGAIDTSLEPGDVVILKGALSDEGTSKHYYSGGKRFGSSASLTRALEKSFRKGNIEYSVGEAWTVDAPYRETREKVARFRRLGARVVNMESSALFAVAKYRRVEAASAQIVSDIVSEKKWNPAFHHDVLNERRQQVLVAVLRAIGS